MSNLEIPRKIQLKAKKDAFYIYFIALLKPDKRTVTFQKAQL